jgi:hypothetical protein
MSIISKLRSLFGNETSEKQGCAESVSPNLFSADRFYGRMCGFALAILQKREPEQYSDEKIKGKDDTYLLIMALTVLNEEEQKIYNQLITLRKERPSKGSYAESALGVVEGAKVVREELDVKLLVEEKDI